MPYVYRYINLEKEEVCYIGKVTKHEDFDFDPVRNRHNQHRGEKWYKEIGDENLMLQYMPVYSHTDADILETWLINYYCKTGQLVNKAKTNWGDSSIDLLVAYGVKWENFGREYSQTYNLIKEETDGLVSMLVRQTNGLQTNTEDYLSYFTDRIRELAKECQKANRISNYESQGEFLRRIENE